MERNPCNAWSTGPGAWPRRQFSATRALYLGPDGGAGDLLESGVMSVMTDSSPVAATITNRTALCGSFAATPRPSTRRPVDRDVKPHIARKDA